MIDELLNVLTPQEKELLKEVIKEAKPQNNNCGKAKPQQQAIKPKPISNFQNDCKMHILQLKAFVFDALQDPNKRNSRELLDFLDDLNAISVAY
ncbi:MAG: hypothetical protein Nk1A_8920 [Endomicrobiia bacterium]|nr:MAG: hypothetical protein Nk1A_8920 [Endomicrobiia bacterium]